MNDIKIVIDTKTDKVINATMYMVNEQTGQSNAGTIWMTHDEFEMFTNSLAMGLPDERQLIVDDPTETDQYIDD